MNLKEFEKTIKIEELAKTNDTQKYMLKSYLDILLKGGKLRETASLYNIIRSLSVFLKEGQLFPDLIRDAKQSLIDLFLNLKEEKKWTIEEIITTIYDENGEEISLEEPLIKAPTISKKIIQKIYTTFYIDNSLDIKSLIKSNECINCGSKENLTETDCKGSNEWICQDCKEKTL